MTAEAFAERLVARYWQLMARDDVPDAMLDGLLDIVAGNGHGRRRVGIPSSAGNARRSRPANGRVRAVNGRNFN